MSYVVVLFCSFVLVPNYISVPWRNTDCNTLTEFLRSQPPTFSEAREPLEADDWLRTFERKFAALHVPAAEQVNYATYLLNGAAGSWWESHVSMFDAGHVVTWAEFRTAFRAAYIPKPIMDLKRREFLELMGVSSTTSLVTPLGT